MTAELWLMKRCSHGSTEPCDGDRGYECPGGSRVRLNPDQVVRMRQDGRDVYVSVKGIIDALTEQETDQ